LLPGEICDIFVGLFLKERVVSPFDAGLVTDQSFELSLALSELLGVEVKVFGIGLVIFNKFLDICNGRILHDKMNVQVR
jgi:predicted Kef-type K+ transport protein